MRLWLSDVHTSTAYPDCVNPKQIWCLDERVEQTITFSLSSIIPTDLMLSMRATGVKTQAGTYPSLTASKGNKKQKKR